MRLLRLLNVACGSALFAACMVVAPLDDVNTNDGGAGSGGDAEGGGQSCTTNLECSQRNADQPYRCLGNPGVCVPLLTQECQRVYDGHDGKDYTNPNAVFLGAFANYGRFVGESSDIYNYRLALEELSGNKAGGLPGPSNAARPVVLTVCDNADSNPDRANVVKRGLQHLVDDLHVPGLLAALREEDLLANFGEFGTQKGTFFLSPSGANAALEDVVVADGLLWFMLGLPKQIAPGYVKLLEKLEQRIKAQQTVTSIKVAVISTRQGFDSELTDAVLKDLHFNGHNIGDPANDPYKLLVDVTSVPNMQAVLAQIIAFAPNVVMSLAGEVFTDSMIERLENDLGNDGTYFVLSPINAGGLERKVKPLIAASLGGISQHANQRFFGVNVAGSADRNLLNAYQSRLGLRFPNAILDAENYYDAMYFLVDAVHAGNPRGSSVIGADVRNGMKRLISGTEQQHYDVGPDSVSAVYTYLDSSSAAIRLYGTLGPPNFTVAGIRVNTAGIYCFEKTLDTSNNYIVKEQNDVLRIDDSGALVFSNGYDVSNAPCLNDSSDR